MGNVSSRLDDPNPLYLEDQNRLAIASLSITNSEGKTIFDVTPNNFPATFYNAKKDSSDPTPVDYVQDPVVPSSGPAFLLKLTNDSDLFFNFTFTVRQPTPAASSPAGANNAPSESADTLINGLTFAHVSNNTDLENLVTREFHANPNIQKNANVQLIGDYTTSGVPSVQFNWSWKWEPPKRLEDKGRGWRNCCSFLDYDQHTNRLNPLAVFSFWVANICPSPRMGPGLTVGTAASAITPGNSIRPGSRGELGTPNSSRSRVPSTQSILSRSELGPLDEQRPLSLLNPLNITEPPQPTSPAPPPSNDSSTKLDVNCNRPSQDEAATVEDGPLFRATMKTFEDKTGIMRAKIKKVLKKAEAAHSAQMYYNDAVNSFITALEDASISSTNAFQPVMDHYFHKIARQIISYEELNAASLRKFVIEPLSKVYSVDIKQADSKRKEFEEESKDYYSFVGRYLSHNDSLKEKKRAEIDSKYLAKRRNFELKRFDYFTYLQDLHGGRKEQEVLHYLTRFADSQTHCFINTAKTTDRMLPQLEALVEEVSRAGKEFEFQRTEREKKRRAIERTSKPFSETSDSSNTTSATAATLGPSSGAAPSGGINLSEQSNIDQLRSTDSAASTYLNRETSDARSKTLRDLESSADESDNEKKKEGLLWALSKPGSHWHKYWIVLDQGQLSEYTNWKQKPEVNFEPIDLRVASVREARDVERRFCFELITPHLKRIYQATSEEDMYAWIHAIKNALQSAVEGRGASTDPLPPPTPVGSTNPSAASAVAAVVNGGDSSSHHHHHSSIYHRRDIGAVLTGKPSSLTRRTTVGHRPNQTYSSGLHHSQSTSGPKSGPHHSPVVKTEHEKNLANLLQMLRDSDEENGRCADCGSTSKVEWVSINFGMVMCIECSGIHRSLGTHISKIRSLTLDVNSFSPDIVELLIKTGNRMGNSVWEGQMDAETSATKPNPHSTPEQKLKYATAKYSQGAFVQPFATRHLPFSTPEEMLISSLKQKDIRNVLYAIALKANLDATDPTHGTSAVYVALSATDPAPEESLANSPVYPATTASLVVPLNVKPVPFAMAELLLQNGATLPTHLPSIPLSPAARLFVAQRAAKTKEKSSIPASTQPSSATPGHKSLLAVPSSSISHTNDSDHHPPPPSYPPPQLPHSTASSPSHSPAPPYDRRRPSLGPPTLIDTSFPSANNFTSPVQPPSPLTHSRSNNERNPSLLTSPVPNKTQKRGSAGARLAGKVVALGLDRSSSST